MKIILGILFAATLFVPSAKASPTAGGLSGLCDSDKQVDAAICLGYVSGWMDALNGTNFALDNGKVIQVVFADGVTAAQVSRVFIKYVSAHPEIENKLASGELVDALVDAKLIGFKPVLAASIAH